MDPSGRLPESMTKHAAPTREWLSGREFLVGVTEDEFVRRAEAAGFNVRVVVRDGHSYPRRANYDPKRINVEVADGSVSRSEGVG
jgi:hypothetical protein